MGTTYATQPQRVNGEFSGVAILLNTRLETALMSLEILSAGEIGRKML